MRRSNRPLPPEDVVRIEQRKAEATTPLREKYPNLIAFLWVLFALAVLFGPIAIWWNWR